MKKQARCALLAGILETGWPRTGYNELVAKGHIGDCNQFAK
jgi:hypothetical protein